MSAMNTTAHTSHASRNSPRSRSTGIQAQADRQIRSVASAVVTSSSGAASSTHSFTSGLSKPAPSSSAVIAIAPRMSAGAESRTKCFWSGVGFASGTLRTGRPRRLGGRCSSPGRIGGDGAAARPRPRRSRRHRRRHVRHRLPVQHRHPGLPALVVHGPSLSPGRPEPGHAPPSATLPAALMTLRRAAHASPVAIAPPHRAPTSCRSSACCCFGWDLTTLVALYWAENGVVGAVRARPDPDRGRRRRGPEQRDDQRRPRSAAQLRNPAPPASSSCRSSPSTTGCSGWSTACSCGSRCRWCSGADGRRDRRPEPRRVPVGAAGPRCSSATGRRSCCNWILGGERCTSSPAREMGAPYGRVMSST